MAKRYNHMLALIAEVKPKTIVEVGVHRAKRANMLCREALKHSDFVHYIGYDVFDTMGDQFQADALNGKGTPTEREARKVLDAMPGGFTYQLVVGDTCETLHGQRIEADFAFIDGDHRVEAIRGDYEALKESKVVVLDDFYVAGARGELPDLTRYGANTLVDELRATGMSVEILPSGDVCNHGAISCLVAVRR